MPEHILLVEDDESLAFLLRSALEEAGYRVSIFADGKSAQLNFQKGVFDLCVLDLMLPVLDGFALGRYIRSMDQNLPIIFLTARSNEEDKIKGFKVGADDYISKPFSIEELKLRIRVILRRANPVAAATCFGGFQFNYANQELLYDGTKTPLTQKEADLLKYLLERSNQKAKRADILKDLWGDDDYFMGRSLDVFISKLRKHLAKDPRVSIMNYHGVGFMLKID